MQNKKCIITLKNVLKTSGLGTFLVLGLNSCVSNNCANKPNKELKQCYESNSTSTSSGFFAPLNSSNNKSSGG